MSVVPMCFPVDGVTLDVANPPELDLGSGNRPKLLFSPDTVEYFYVEFRLPSIYLSDPKLILQYSMASAISGDIVFVCNVMAVTPEDAVDMDTDSYDATNSTVDIVPGTAGRLVEVEVDLTNFDGALAGDYLTLRASRWSDLGADNATGDLELWDITFEFEAS